MTTSHSDIRDQISDALKEISELAKKIPAPALYNALVISLVLAAMNIDGEKGKKMLHEDINAQWKEARRHGFGQ